MDQNIIISIVIRTFNEEKYLPTLLKKIFKQKIYKEFEVIIVDSGSTDRTLSIAKNFPIKITSISQEKFSFGSSLNTGIRNSQGEYVVIISAHCYPINDNWLNEITKPFSNKKVALVYGKQRGNHLTKFSETQIFKKMFPIKSNQKQLTPFCNNANAAIRKSLWRKINYDENITGLEDMDWAKKILNNNYYIYYNGLAAVIHIHEETNKEIFKRYMREAIAMRKIFLEINFTFIDFLKLFFINIFLDYFRSFIFDFQLRNLWEIPIFRFMQYWGTYRGYRYKKQITAEIKKFFYYPRPVNKSKKNHL